MTGRTDYTEYDNNMPPEGPAQMNGIFEHFDPLIGESAALISDLPSGTWKGRTITVEEDGSVRNYDGTNYRTVYEDTGWQLPTFSGSGWANFGSVYETAAYRRRNGMVIIKGFVKGGTNTTLFTLPVGFRPGELLVRTVGSATGHALVNITPAGAFQVTAYLTGGTNANVQIACTFFAEG